MQVPWPQCGRVSPKRSIVLQCQFADLGVQCFDIDGWTRRFRLRFIAKNARRPLQELVYSTV